MSPVEKHEAIAKRKSEPDLSSYALTDFGFDEFFCGGSECLPFLRPRHWPFSFIRLFGEEEE
jgi:hypothetical protein